MLSMLRKYCNVSSKEQNTPACRWVGGFGIGIISKYTHLLFCGAIRQAGKLLACRILIKQSSSHSMQPSHLSPPMERLAHLGVVCTRPGQCLPDVGPSWCHFGVDVYLAKSSHFPSSGPFPDIHRSLEHHLMRNDILQLHSPPPP